MFPPGGLTRVPGVSDSPRTPTGTPATAGGRGLRSVAAAVCALQALGLVGLAVFYVYELVTGVSSDVLLVVGSAAVVVVLAAGLGGVARGWLRWTRWPRTPTVVWHLLLLPVAAGMLQGGQGLLGGVVLVLALVGLGAAFGAPRPPDVAFDADPADDAGAGSRG